MGEFRRHKRILAWLAIVALLGNAVVAALYFAPARAAPLVDSILGPLVICTSHGTETVPPDGGSSPHSPSDHCPACTLVAKIALVVTVVLLATAALPALPAVRPVPVRSRRLAVHLGPGGIRSRAPPAGSLC
jgi:DUF2946 family protein